MKNFLYNFLFERKFNGIDFIILYYVVHLANTVNSYWVLLALPASLISMFIEAQFIRFARDKEES